MTTHTTRVVTVLYMMSHKSYKTFLSRHLITINNEKVEYILVV